MADIVDRSGSAISSRAGHSIANHPVLWAWLGVATVLVACWSLGYSPNSDPDDLLKLAKVRSFLATGAWFDQTVPGILQPEPFVSHWPRILDLPYALVAAALAPFAGLEAGLRIAAFAVPLLLLLPALAHYRRVVSALGFQHPDAVFALCLIPALRAFFEFIPDRIDYHNLQIVFLLASIALTMSRSGPAALANGAVVALAMATSIEFALFFALGMAVYAVEYIIGNEGSRRRLGLFGAGLGGAALLAYPVVVAPGYYDVAACDSFSAPHLLAFVFAGVSFVGAALIAARWLRAPPPPRFAWSSSPVYGGGSMARPAATSGPPLRSGGGGPPKAVEGGRATVLFAWRPALLRALLIVLPAAAGLVLLVHLFPECLAGPYAGLSPYLRSAWLLEIPQELSLLARPEFVLSPDMVNAALLLIGAAAPSVLAAFTRIRDRSLVIFALFALLAMAQAVLYFRYFRYLPLFAAPGLLFVLAALLPGLREKGALLANRSGVGASAAMLAPGILVSAALVVFNIVTPAKASKPPAAGLAGSCDIRAIGAPAWPHGARIMAPPAIGIALLPELGGAAVVAVPFHTGTPGLERAYRFLDPATPDPRAVLDGAQATHVALCAWRGSPSAALKAQYPFAARLMEGQAPDWLVECPTSKASPLRIYRYPAAGGDACPAE